MSDSCSCHSLRTSSQRNDHASHEIDSFDFSLRSRNYILLLLRSFCRLLLLLLRLLPPHPHGIGMIPRYLQHHPPHGLVHRRRHHLGARRPMDSVRFFVDFVGHDVVRVHHFGVGYSREVEDGAWSGGGSSLCRVAYDNGLYFGNAVVGASRGSSRC